MGETHIVDMTHYQLPDGSLPQGPAGRIPEYFGSIVSAASAHPAGEWVDVAIRCRRRPSHKQCPGHIRLRRIDVHSHVEWHCTSCGDNGIISNWRNSMWDLTQSRQEAPAESLLQIRVSEEELQELRKTLLLDPEAEAIVCGAVVTSKGIFLRGSLEGLEELAGYVAAEANHESMRKRQQILDAVAERIEAVISEHGV